MVGVALGCAARGPAITFSSTFAAFFTRTFDQLRMAAVSQSSAIFCGSHPGVSIGKLLLIYLFIRSFVTFLDKHMTLSRLELIKRFYHPHPRYILKTCFVKGFLKTLKLSINTNSNNLYLHAFLAIVIKVVLERNKN